MARKARIYDTGHLTDAFFVELKQRYEGHNPANMPRREGESGERRIVFGYEGVEYSVKFTKLEEGILCVDITARTPVSKLRQEIGDKADLSHLLKEAHAYDFLGEHEISDYGKDTDVYLAIRRRILEIPVGKEGHISGNLYKGVMASIVAPVNRHLHSEGHPQMPKPEPPKKERQGRWY